MRCPPLDRDRYGRVVARCATEAVPDLGRALLAQGRAIVYGRFTAGRTDQEIVQEKIARGSHGALVGGRPENALRVDALAALFNDAGIGAAGVGRLPALDERGIAAVAVAADSARIGDGRSTYFDGVLTRVNRTAERAGVTDLAGRPAAVVEVVVRQRGGIQVPPLFEKRRHCRHGRRRRRDSGDHPSHGNAGQDAR